MLIKTMKRLTIVFLGLIFVSFTNDNPNYCIPELFSMVDKTKIGKYNKLETKDSIYGIRHSIDSINYKIIRRWENDGTPILESISNKLINIDHWVEYYNNGKIQKIGYLTSTHHKRIGKWQYFSQSGELDSIVNYDIKYKVSFCEFYRISQEKGLTGENSYFDFDERSRKWQIIKWEYFEDSAIATGIQLQVDSLKINNIHMRGIY
jgi:antitoxin component YwqK of YwqJK toxin-antitoxin module